MNPLAAAAIGAIFRWALAFGAGWLVQKGIWTQGESAEYIAALSMALVSLLWGVWQKYRSRLHFLVALDTPAGTDEQTVKALVKDHGWPLKK